MTENLGHNHFCRTLQLDILSSFPPLISTFSCTSVLENYDSLTIQNEVKNIQKHVCFLSQREKRNNAKRLFHDETWKRIMNGKYTKF